MMTRCGLRASFGVAAGLLAATIAAPASAQISVLAKAGPAVRVLPGSGIQNAFVRDVAYDPGNGVYLIVANAQQSVWGLFLNVNGNPIGAAFRISTQFDPQPSGAFLAYSAHVSNGAGGLGGFLVVWHQDFQVNTVRGRIVGFPGILVGSELTIPGGFMDQVVYSPVSRTFLIAGSPGATLTLTRVGIDGEPIGQFVTIPFPGGGRFARVSWNSVLDEFGVFVDSGTQVGTLLRIGPDGTVVRRTDLNVGRIGLNAALDFNAETGAFVLAWEETVPFGSTLPFGLFAAEVTGTGDLIAQGRISSLTAGISGRITLTYSPVTHTFLLLSTTDSSRAIKAFELNGHGAPISTKTTVMAGNSSPQAVPRVDAGAWLVFSAVTPVTFLFPTLFPPPPSFTEAQAVVTSSDGFTSTWTLATSGCQDPGGAHDLAGDQCVNGEWYPAVDAPTIAALPLPVFSDGSCVTPDPFLALGGVSTCKNGNWYPPGMPVPEAPAAPPPPPTPPAPVPGGCTIPDPFVSLGGGTCVNGDWYPPGMPVPTEPPPLPPHGASCPGSDPFIGLPGLAGVCINGDWIPTELLQTSATVRFHTAAGGFWALDLDDGRFFVPLAGLPPALQVNGLRVTFTGKVRIDLASTQGPIVEVLTIQ